MSSLVKRLGDQMLERLVPSADATADTSFYDFCHCSYKKKYYRLCHVVGGMSSCSNCTYVRGTC
ncbi:hypothetical protein OG883_01470 [Streptomyces sp. NBC_01142]|uniref:hypothetical protein n=1 Tax=Streptomyces sp. NBC_01142 TaxID=2975865 RepID=UPI0022547A9C|nr:hypothetical protein [Streptomyces sp. NBC_01142]MCX4818596.1 hypothetical protein [Streptomyces sp. NBC_01142]